MKELDNRKEYIPHPADTTGIELPDELIPLLEEMARNVHEVWAANRIKEGWKFGNKRDDFKKTHPCLIPYDDLPEIEKEYDRNTSRETLRLILKSGFEIKKV